MKNISTVMLLIALSGDFLNAFSQDLPAISPVKNQMIQTGSEDKDHSKPIICKTGAYIKTVRIHQAEEFFEVLFYWWLRVDSIDPKGDYSEVSNIEFINADNIETSIDEKKEDLSQGFYYITGHCKASIPYKADYRRFPFDTQELCISIENKNNNIENIIYVPDEKENCINQLSDHNIEILNGDQFSIIQLKSSQSTYTYKTHFGDPTLKDNDRYSRISFIMDVQRNPSGILIKLTLPLLVVLVLAYLVFYIPDHEIGTASALTVTALLAAIAFQWTLNDSLPKVSYMTIVDKIFYLVYFFIFYALMQTVLTYNLSSQGERMKKLSDLIENHSRYLFPALFLILLMFLLI